jgi:hypothetical protein
MAHALNAYRQLVSDLQNAGYALHPIRRYFQVSGEQSVVYLRHDVDRLPNRAVAMAEAEAALDVRSTYYFRCDARARFPEQAMRHIASLGHEPGFHYESLSRAGGDAAAAARLFERELAACRAIVPVQTVAPHGAPLASASNMDFSGTIDAGALSLLGDATDLDYTEMLYVTDTGGTFGSRYNLRDKPAGRHLIEPLAPTAITDWIVRHGITRITLSCHPERWPASGLRLVQATITDAAANAAKVVLGQMRRT